MKKINFISLFFLSAILLLLGSCTNSPKAFNKSIDYKNQSIIDLANKMEELGMVENPLGEDSNNSGKQKIKYKNQSNDGIDITNQPKMNMNPERDYDFGEYFKELRRTYNTAVEIKQRVLNSTSYVNKWDFFEYVDSEFSRRYGYRISYNEIDNHVILEEYASSYSVSDLENNGGSCFKVYVDEKSDKIHYTYEYIAWNSKSDNPDKIENHQYIDYKEDDYCIVYDRGTNIFSGVKNENFRYIDLKGEYPIYYNCSITYNSYEIFWFDDNGFNYWTNKGSSFSNYYMAVFDFAGTEYDSVDICLYALDGIKKITLYDYVNYSDDFRFDYKIEFDNGMEEHIICDEFSWSSEGFQFIKKDNNNYPYIHFNTTDTDEINAFLSTYGLSIKDNVYNYLGINLDFVPYFSDLSINELCEWLYNMANGITNEIKVDDYTSLSKDYDNVDEIFTLLNYEAEVTIDGTIKIEDNKLNIKGFNLKVDKLIYKVKLVEEEVNPYGVDIEINGKIVTGYNMENGAIHDEHTPYITDLSEFNLDYNDLKIVLIINNGVRIEVPSDYIKK
ncbi:MAG: hypothetical protein IJM36_00110 [Acholeplasmatales bacterium]|nr:hypothetical protein [Acholeplasmatales bacterium]